MTKIPNFYTPTGQSRLSTGEQVIGRTYGGPSTRVVNGIPLNLVVSHAIELPKVVNSVLAKKPDESIILDVACANGPSTWSVLSIIRAFLPQGKASHIDGIDIDPKAIEKAKTGVYQASEALIFNSGYYANSAMRENDEQLRKESAKNPKYKDANDFLQGTFNFLVENYLKRLFVNNAEPDSNGDISVRPEEKRNIDYFTGSAFDLPTESYDLISCQNLFGLLSSEGAEEVLQQMAKNLKPGGIVFSDLFISPHSVFQPGSKIAPVVDRYFNLLPSSGDNYYSSAGIPFYPSLLKRNEAEIAPAAPQIIDLALNVRKNPLNNEKPKKGFGK